MTIVTKPLSGEKKPDVQPLVDGADLEKATKGSDGNGTSGLNERYHYILRTRAARVSSATTLCLLIMALLVMTVGLFGGLYIYKQMTRTRKLWCNVPYPDSPFANSRIFKNDNDLASPLFSIPQLENNGLRKIDEDGLTYLFGDDPKPDVYYRENFELDTEDETFSKIDVPDFKNGRMGRFIHEFDSNKTAIVDKTTNRCFIMPLDREKISPPKTMFDMIQKMSAGYYSVNTRNVRENMRVVLPAMTDLSDLGEYIKKECIDKSVYRLEKSTDRVIKKRSLDADKPFAEFAGTGTIEYFIENMGALP